MDLPFLETKIARRPSSPLFSRLADEYLKSGLIQQAKQTCTKGLRSYPTYVGAHVVLAKCFAAEKDYTSAINQIQKALKEVPYSPVLLRFKEEWEELRAKPVPVVESPPVPIPEPEPIAAAPTPVVELVTAVADAEIKPVESVQPVETVSIEPQPVVEEQPPKPVIREIFVPTGLSETTIEEEPAVQAAGEPATFDAEKEPVIPPAELPQSFVEGEKEIRTIDELEEARVSSLRDRISESQDVESLPDITEIPFMGTEKDESEPEPEQPSVEPPAVPEPTKIIEEPPIKRVEPTASSAPEVDYEGRIASKTLAEIYAQQGEFAEAILTYQLLKYRRPEMTEEIDRRIRELQDMLSSKSL